MVDPEDFLFLVTALAVGPHFKTAKETFKIDLPAFKVAPRTFRVALGVFNARHKITDFHRVQVFEMSNDQILVEEVKIFNERVRAEIEISNGLKTRTFVRRTFNGLPEETTTGLEIVADFREQLEAEEVLAIVAEIGQVEGEEADSADVAAAVVVEDSAEEAAEAAVGEEDDEGVK